MKLHISKGNSKLGGIPNVSLPPVITCRKNAPCASDGCYALKFYKMYPSCHKAWDENLELWKTDPGQFWTELRAVFATTKYFRYFVSGDIPDADFFSLMVIHAGMFPDTQFLCFTKQFEIVNDYCRNHPSIPHIPSNLHLLFSGWEGLEVDNPYGFPTTEVITPEMTEVPDDWKICGGNCSDCICRGVGCWEVKHGDVIAFHKH